MFDSNLRLKGWYAKKVFCESDRAGNFLALLTLWEEGGGGSRKYSVIYRGALVGGSMTYFLAMFREEGAARNSIGAVAKEDMIPTDAWLAKALFGPDVERNPALPVEVAIPSSLRDVYNF